MHKTPTSAHTIVLHTWGFFEHGVVAQVVEQLDDQPPCSVTDHLGQAAAGLTELLLNRGVVPESLLHNANLGLLTNPHVFAKRETACGLSSNIVCKRFWTPALERCTTE